MKSIKRHLMIVVFMASSMTVFAHLGGGESNAVKKARQAVEEAAPYDWKTLAKSAKVCFEKNENIEAALKWIDKSIEINKDPLNLEIKGDYFASSGKKQQALEYYNDAINTGKKQNFWFDSSDLQTKMWKLRETE